MFQDHRHSRYLFPVTASEAMVSDEFRKHRRPKTREVSSRYLTPVSPAILLFNRSSSPSPTQRKSPLGSSETRKHLTMDVQKPRRASSNEFVGIENENRSSKENHRLVLERSMRYSSKSHNLGKSTSSSSSKLQSITLSDNSGKISPASSPRMGISISSKYLNDEAKRTQRRSSDPSFQTYTNKGVIKRTNSISGYGSSTSQWALSPGRSDSPPMSIENMEKIMSFSSLKPKEKGISSSPSQSTGSAVSESFHQLRLLHNRMLQWRFLNARADSTNKRNSTSAKIKSVSSWKAVSDLRRTVLLKRLQTQKEKMETKMILILLSQRKPLESWGEMERQHLTALNMTKQCLNSVVCRIPLVDGATMEGQSTATELRQASDLSGLIKSTTNLLSPAAQKTAALLSELSEVTAEEKLLLEECVNLCRIISPLQIQEMWLRSEVVQFEEQRRISA